MLPQEFVDRIDAAPIVQVIERFGAVEMQGNKCCCPIHRERTPSLSVSPAKNLWHCFGCGRGGGPVQFLMALGMTWIESVRSLAEMLGEEFPQDGPPDPAMQARQQARSAQFAACLTLQTICEHALREPATPDAQEALGYCVNRFGDPRTPGTPAHDFGLGYMPHDIITRLAARNARREDLIAAGLFSERDWERGGTLRGRLIIPIRDAAGRPVGFSGRALQGQNPKYINTRSSDVFTKGDLLFGYDAARRAAQSTGRLVLVEGYADAMRLWAVGVEEVVAVMGTSLSAAQIKSITRAARAVMIVPDGDNPGSEACARWGWALAAQGVYASVALLPTRDDGAKADADSVIRSREDWDALKPQDFLLHVARREWVPLTEADGPARAQFAQRMLTALGQFDEEYQELTARELDSLTGGTYWRDALRRRSRREEPTQGKARGADTASSATLASYGFEVREGCIWSSEREGKMLRPVSNFVVEPLFYIRAAGGNAHRRLIRVTNTRGEARLVVLEANADSLFSASRFRNAMVREGNYSYTASEWSFLGLFRYINDGCTPCHEIARLGWQPADDMFAWANGVYAHGAWYPLGDNGTVEVQGKHYWLDAQAHGGRLAASMRYRPGDTSLGVSGWVERMYHVFGGYGVLASLYVAATLHRDTVREVGPLPLLNACGPRGTGKSALALSLVGLFFERPTLLNLPTSTLASLNTILSSFSHVPIALDEYSNSVGPAKVELLKSSYDGGGRQKMVGPTQIDSTEVHSGVVLCGQQLAESDPALFSRLLYMQFARARYSDEETAALQALRLKEAEGLGHVVHALLDLRPAVAQSFRASYLRARADVEAMLKEAGVEWAISRTVHAWSVLLAMYYALGESVAFPCTREAIMSTFADTLREQSREMDDGDDVRGFWATFVYLVNRGELRADVDYHIEERDWVTGPSGTRIALEHGKRKVIHLVLTTVIPLYERHGANVVGDSLLSPSTMRSYLRKSDAFISSSHQVLLRVSDGRGGVQYDTDGTGPARMMRQKKKCYSFYYDMLDIDVERVRTDEEPEGGTSVIQSMDEPQPPF